MTDSKRFSRWSLKGLSLGVKLSLALTVLLGVSYFLLVSSLVGGFTSTAEANARLHGTDMLESIQGGIHNSLMIDDGQGVQAVLNEIAEHSNGVESIRLINLEGEVIHATNPADIGTHLTMESESCAACHRGEGEPVSPGTQMRELASEQRFMRIAFARPIQNNHACSNAACHAHDPAAPKLGLIEAELTMASMLEQVGNVRARSALIAIGLLVLTVLIVFFLTYRIVSRPLRFLREGAVKLSELDLSHRVAVSSGDEIGEIASTFNDTLTYLDELLESIRQAVVQLNAATAELFATSGQQENAATDQSSAVEETRRTMEGLVGAANEIADGAGSVLETAEKSMSASTVIGERIAKLNDQAMSISEIAETIRGIAEKSDILALNASLEGTKAGEIGRGFALVGAEMRRLAESVMEAVVQVRGLASEIRELSQSAVLASEEGQKLAKETTETSKRITLVTNQQRTATEQVRASMDELQNLATQSVRGATQSKATANDLMQTARALSAIIESAQLGGGQGDGSDQG